MVIQLALLGRSGTAVPGPDDDSVPVLSALQIGVDPALDGIVTELLHDAGLASVKPVVVPTLGAALAYLARSRPTVMFLGLGSPDLGHHLNATLVRVQAAAPGVPVVPVPVPSHGEKRISWAAMRLRHGFERGAVLTLLHKLALLCQNAHQLFHLATHDQLTGLANRWLLEERLRHAITRSRRSGQPGALLFLDLDGFKRVNDRLGHEAGDRMLVLVAERLRAAVRASDTVARWGGDEFAVILESVESRAVAREAGRRLQLELMQPGGDRGQGTVRASVGVAMFPTDGSDVPTLLAQADRRMYRAKGRRMLRAILCG